MTILDLSTVTEYTEYGLVGRTNVWFPDEGGKTSCPSRGSIFGCTRPVGHEDAHVAETIIRNDEGLYEVVAAWPQEK